MSEQDTGQERTEEPTPKRREDFRNKGKTANSRELTSVGVLAAASLGIALSWDAMVENLGQFTREMLGPAVTNPEVYLETSPLPLLFDVATRVMVSSAAPVLAAATAGLLLSVAQVGLHWSGESMKPDIKKFDPIKGLQTKLFSAQAIAEWVKAMVKLLVVGSSRGFPSKSRSPGPGAPWRPSPRWSCSPWASPPSPTSAGLATSSSKRCA